jgi:hypothetical protein
MKIILLTMMLSSTTFAANYNCRASMVKMELNTNSDMTSLIIKDFQTGEFYYNGIVSESVNRDGRTDLIFETKTNTFLQFQFKTSDLETENERMFGFVRGWFGAGFIDQSLQCIKKII